MQHRGACPCLPPQLPLGDPGDPQAHLLPGPWAGPACARAISRLVTSTFSGLRSVWTCRGAGEAQKKKASAENQVALDKNLDKISPATPPRDTKASSVGWARLLSEVGHSLSHAAPIHHELDPRVDLKCNQSITPPPPPHPPESASA